MKTMAPYAQNIARQMKVRAYDVEVLYPDGTIHLFESMGHFAQASGHILPHVRASCVWFEMKIGDVAENTWTDPEGGTYHFTFMRRK
ncbi:TPA: hypothetical protein ACNEJR_003700 [Escherichia coli]